MVGIRTVPGSARTIRRHRRVALLLTLLVAALPWEIAAFEPTPDEQLAVYYLSDYFLLEDASPLRDYTRAEFLKPPPEDFTLFRPGPFSGMYVYTRVDTPTAEFGLGNLSFGPITLSGSVSGLSAGWYREVSPYPYIEWTASDTLTNGVLVAPRLGIGGSLRLFDVAELEYQHAERHFYRTTARESTTIGQSRLRHRKSRAGRLGEHIYLRF